MRHLPYSDNFPQPFEYKELEERKNMKSPTAPTVPDLSEVKESIGDNILAAMSKEVDAEVANESDYSSQSGLQKI